MYMSHIQVSVMSSTVKRVVNHAKALIQQYLCIAFLCHPTLQPTFSPILNPFTPFVSILPYARQRVPKYCPFLFPR